jgi:phosphinothricin acetyltransferase
MTPPSIRPPREEDLPALTEIYNHYIRETPITFDLEPYTVEARRPWLASFAPKGRYRILVAEKEGRTLGWACSRRFRDRAAYDPSIEVSVYLAPDAGGRGLGTELYTRLFRELEGEDVHRAFAGVTLPNEASVALHRKFGFTPCGVMSHAGRKFERYWDVGWFEKEL